MSDLNDLLVDSLQDLLSAENQIVGALPKMVMAARCAKLKEGFQKHLAQTETHVERLKSALDVLGESSDSKPCKGMKGILDEGEEAIHHGEDRDELTSDLGLIAAAQKVEHYEIAAYKSAHCLAKQIENRDVARLLAHTLGEEESTDFLLSELSRPLLQQASSVEVGNGTKAPWGEPGNSGVEKPVVAQRKVHATVGSGTARLQTRKAKA
jgi:Mn-containing catalase